MGDCAESENFVRPAELRDAEAGVCYPVGSTQLKSFLYSYPFKIPTQAKIWLEWGTRLL